MMQSEALFNANYHGFQSLTKIYPVLRSVAVTVWTSAKTRLPFQRYKMVTG